MKKKTHEEYVDEIKDFSIEVVDTYINARTPILHKCKKCGHMWDISPDNLLHGYGCPCCAGVIGHTTNSFKEALLKVNSQIEVISEYVNAKTKITCKCLIDGHEWSAVPRMLLQGHGYPVCAGNKKKTHLEYVEDVSKINSDIEVLGLYINTITPILHRCKIDGTEWLARPNNILNGKGCPKCHASIGEKIISSYLNKYEIAFEPQCTFKDCKNIKLLPFDFYLPEYHSCIEYDGIQHFEARDFFGGEEEFAKRQCNDFIKTTYCSLNDIKLLRIRYDQNIEEELNKFFNNTKLIKEVI